jgi:catechol 2,3-dioxygenase-like lactoylglutathione lyase family enzyme
MIQAKRIGHATFATPDLDQQIEHFRDVVGLHLVARDGGCAYLATNAGQLVVVLEKADRADCTRLAFEVSPRLSFADMARELSAFGLQSEKRTDDRPGLASVLSFKDPKGTIIELFSEPRFVERGEAVGGATPLKLGHVAFAVEDPRLMAEFYERVLGFRTSDWIGDFFVFLRCNSDHHTVNFIRAPRARMHHIAFEMRDAAHLHNSCDLLGQRRIEIVWGPVRHGPGHNVATYHCNPDHQMIEFFAELDRMTDEENGFFDPRPWHRDQPQRPKVWDPSQQRDMWGLRPSQAFLDFAK